jgi:hypothetical protein
LASAEKLRLAASCSAAETIDCSLGPQPFPLLSLSQAGHPDFATL